MTIPCAAPAGGLCSSTYSASQDRLGPAFGAGVEWKFGRLRLAPEFRYVHLNRSSSDQYHLLLGISF